MRIARVLTRLNLGGPARQVLASDPELQRRGHDLLVLAGSPEPGEGDLTAALRERGVEVRRVPGLRRGVAPAGDLRARVALGKELARFRPDVVHTHASKAGTLGRAAARRVPAAATVHTFHGHVLDGYFPEPVSKRLRAHEARLARTTDRIVAVAHATADDLVRLGVCEEERLVVVPPGVELDALLALPLPRLRDPATHAAHPLRRELGAGPDATLVGVLGRLAEVKRTELAVDAFATIAARHPSAHLAFVGDGDQRRALEKRIGALPEALRERVHLLGARDDVAAVLGGLDLVLSSSRSEGLPVALIEAGAAALPVVATDVGGVAELVAHERTGWLVPTEQGGDGLAYALDQALGDPAEARAVGERARLRVASRHSAAALADRLEALYTAVREQRACVS